MSYCVRIRRTSGPPIELDRVTPAGLDRLWSAMVPGGTGFVDFTAGDTRIRLALSDVTSIEHWPMDHAEEGKVTVLGGPSKKLAA